MALVDSQISSVSLVILYVPRVKKVLYGSKHHMVLYINSKHKLKIFDLKALKYCRKLIILINKFG